MYEAYPLKKRFEALLSLPPSLIFLPQAISVISKDYENEKVILGLGDSKDGGFLLWRQAFDIDQRQVNDEVWTFERKTRDFWNWRGCRGREWTCGRKDTEATRTRSQTSRLRWLWTSPSLVLIMSMASLNMRTCSVWRIQPAQIPLGAITKVSVYLSD